MPAVSHGKVLLSSVPVLRRPRLREGMGTSLGNLTAGNHHFGDSIQKQAGREAGRQRSRVPVMS